MICHVQWYTIQTDKNKNKEMFFFFSLLYYIMLYYIMKDIDKVDKYQNKSSP